ncbi:MAG: YjbH domain-containing protein, partial [Chlamydiae bacterium]|nr:YjbH domain-containing protein [Chlamydiota bacterium]
MRKIFILIISLLSSGFTLESQDSSRLFYDLERLEKVDKKLNDRLPLIYNYNLQGGYFEMPSARMGYSGNTVGGYSYVPPYSIYTVAFQYFDHLELSGNYWVFNHQLEGTFGKKGFGNDADRVANAKISFLRKEDGLPYLPEFAIGFNDFIGSQRFHSQYIVATKDFLDQNLEITLGVGRGRIHKIFGG